jgi:hypothetical protein
LQHYVAAFCIISHFDEPEIYGKRDLLRGQSVVIIIMRGDIRFHAQELRIIPDMYAFGIVSNSFLSFIRRKTSLKILNH